jgi:thiamine-phosphate pyrophosphorylase
MRKISDCKLYTFIDTSYLKGRAPEEIARQLCDGGSDIIQLRAKLERNEEIIKIAETILPITEKAGIPLVINDYPEIAKKVGAQYCHLGQEDFFDIGYHTASEITGITKRIGLGLSSHSIEQARRAIDANPDYIAVGPVFATATKPQAKPVTLELVKWAAKNVKIPFFAIGGINLSNIDDVLSAGARRICVVSAILDKTDVVSACKEFKKRMEQ